MWQTTWLRAEFPRQYAQWKQKDTNKHLECNLVRKTLEYNIWGKPRAVRIQAIGSFRAMTKSKQSQGVHRFHFQTPNQAASWIPAKEGREGEERRGNGREKKKRHESLEPLDI